VALSEIGGIAFVVQRRAVDLPLPEVLLGPAQHLAHAGVVVERPLTLLARARSGSIHSLDGTQEHQPGVEALSAGSKPSGVINPKAVRFMAELGYDLSRHASKSLEDIDGEFDAVVTMGCGDSCPWVPAKRREDWALPDPKHMDDAGYRAVRDEISTRVQKLLAAL